MDGYLGSRVGARKVDEPNQLSDGGDSPGNRTIPTVTSRTFFPTKHIIHLGDISNPIARLPEECTILVTEDLTTRAAWQYKPGFHRRHYCTNCDIFFDVNGAVYAHVPQRRLIVPVYDV